MSKGNWGADTTDERKPTWPWVAEYIGYANCFATGSGWTIRWPWGDEVLVALSNLSTKLGVANVTQVIAWAYPTAGYLVNVAAQTLQVAISFNEAVAVSGTPTLVLISTAGQANITLSYNAASSNLASGKLVFGNTNFTLGAAGYAANTLVVNSTSSVANWNTITDVATANAVANGVPAASSLVITVKQEKPVHVATLRVGSANSSVNGQLGFALDFNQAIVISGNTAAISLRAIADANAVNGNLVCSYVAASSNLSLGNLVFQSALTDFTNANAAIYTINSTSVLAGFDGIRNDIGGVTLNTIAVANTFTVAV